MNNQIPMPEAARRYLASEMLGREIAGLVIKDILGQGETAVTYEVVDEYGLRWALKVVTRESYGERAPFREVARFAETADDRFLVFPIGVGDWTLDLGGGETHDFVWFKSRCVRGQTLSQFLAQETQFSAQIEIRRFIENLSAALEELERLGFRHGDLHDRNIMREVVGAQGPSPEVRYVVVDFSEAHEIEAAQSGLSKDVEHFGRHLRSFYDAVHRRDTITRDDEMVLSAVSHIPGLLNGVSPESMGISKAAQVLERFKDGLASVNRPQRQLQDPFHPLNAENIANDALLADLCFTQMWWTAELQKSNNLLLIGPRGCGKTMIFRRLRLKTKIAADKTKELAEDPYVGFYLACESLFYMRFSDLAEVDVDSNRDALVLFFNMAVLSEVSSTLSSLLQSLGQVPLTLAVEMGKLLREEIGVLGDELDLPALATVLVEVGSFAECVMRYIRKSIAYGRQIPCKGSTDFLTRLVAAAKREVPALAEKVFIFFLDDYTEERVPIALQEILHPIVCQRSTDICFKISAHMFGSIYHSPRPLALDEGRNIQVINLGSAYLQRDTKRAEGKVLLGILDQRFRHSEGYGGTVEEWLGRTSYSGGRTLSRALHDPATRPKVKYHGVQCLMDLCTGDYSEMIRMVGEVFREASIAPGAAIRRIDPAVQSRAIERVSREYLSRIRHIRPDGQKLYDIVDRFGDLSKTLLYEHPLVGQGTDGRGTPRKDPYDLLNIYVDDFTKSSRSAQRVWERLQMASIFVELGIAPSQRRVIADRATLRRIYCPAFRTALTSSEHLQLTRQQFEYFVDKPEEYCRFHLKREGISPDQSTLWVGEEVAEAAAGPSEEPAAHLPDDRDRVSLVAGVPACWNKTIAGLPEPLQFEEVVPQAARYDFFLGCMGFEERTSQAAGALKTRNVLVDRAILLEFDLYYDATEKQRPKYEDAILSLTSGRPQLPVYAPVGVQDHTFAKRLARLLDALAGASRPKILFDITSCPSLILSQSIAVLLERAADLTVLYTEPEEYFPTRDEWESGQVRAFGGKVRGPFAGVRFVAKPPILQCDDIGELPTMLVLFPTFNTERTDGVLADVEPAERIWVFGEPHHLSTNDYRIEMSKVFASPIMHPGDKWSLLSTFDYKQTVLALSGIYSDHRCRYRIVIMPHGSKLQTLGVSLFSSAHQVSRVFAMPRTYDPERYSRGCETVWALPLGQTDDLVQKLRAGRALGSF